MRRLGSCDQPHENTHKSTTRLQKRSSISENAPTQRRTPMLPLERRDHSEMRDRVHPSFVPRNAPPGCCLTGRRPLPTGRNTGSGGGTGNYRRLWAVEVGWRGPLPTPARWGQTEEWRSGDRRFPATEFFSPPDREENVRLTFRRPSELRHAKGETPVNNSPDCTTCSTLHICPLHDSRVPYTYLYRRRHGEPCRAFSIRNRMQSDPMSTAPFSSGGLLM